MYEVAPEKLQVVAPPSESDFVNRVSNRSRNLSLPNFSRKKAFIRKVNRYSYKNHSKTTTFKVVFMLKKYYNYFLILGKFYFSIFMYGVEKGLIKNFDLVPAKQI